MPIISKTPTGHGSLYSVTSASILKAIVFMPSDTSTLNPEPAFVHWVGSTTTTLFIRIRLLSVVSSKAIIVVGVGMLAPVEITAMESAPTWASPLN